MAFHSDHRTVCIPKKWEIKFCSLQGYHSSAVIFIIHWQIPSRALKPKLGHSLRASAAQRQKGPRGDHLIPPCALRRHICPLHVCT